MKANNSMRSFFLYVFQVLTEKIMRIKVKWFLTGNIDYFEDRDDIIGPKTTVLELKGLVQIRYKFPAKQVGFIYKRLLEPHTTLGSLGIVDQAAADSMEITVHVFTEEDEEEERALEGNNLLKEPIYEFSHQDYITAMAMLGKDVPVTPERLNEMRIAAPRSRPAFLNQTREASVPTPKDAEKFPRDVSAVAAPVGGGNSKDAEKVIFSYKNYLYGQRTEGSDKRFQIQYPSYTDPFEYWDTRLPEGLVPLPPPPPGKVTLEVFFFGPWEKLDARRFATLVEHMLGVQCGVNAVCSTQAREAGCMYPLVAVPMIMSAEDAISFSNSVFENFGQVQELKAPAPPSAQSGVKSNGGGGGMGCAQQ